MRMLGFYGYYAETPIEVSKVAQVPGDYYGLMGVPITILDKCRFGPDSRYELLDMTYNARINGKKLYARYIIRQKLPQKISEYISNGGEYYRYGDDLLIPEYDKEEIDEYLKRAAS